MLAPLPDTHLPLSVTQVSTYLKQYVEKGFASVLVQGEVTGCKTHGSGHTYFALKDESAVIDAICWRSVKPGVVMADGLMVQCRGRITTYAARSKYQLIVEHVESAGQGALWIQMQQLKTKLLQEGLFDIGRKKKIPDFPQCVGLITSPTGAVLHDMKVRFDERFVPRLLFYPVNVQGPLAVPDIVKAVDYFEHCSPKPDLLIIARGGGSIEDLWAFQSEELVRRVARCSIPIISAIGHETDHSLLDEVADARAPTPTAAAERAAPLVRQLYERVETASVMLMNKWIQIVRMAILHYEHLVHRLYTIEAWTGPMAQKLDDLSERLSRSLGSWLLSREQRIKIAIQGLGSGPRRELPYHALRVHQRWDQIGRAMERCVQLWNTVIAQHTSALIQLSVQRTLQRGFALAMDGSGHVVSTAEQARTLPHLRLKFADDVVPVIVQH